MNIDQNPARDLIGLIVPALDSYWTSNQEMKHLDVMIQSLGVEFGNFFLANYRSYHIVSQAIEATASVDISATVMDKRLNGYIAKATLRKVMGKGVVIDWHFIKGPE